MKIRIANKWNKQTNSFDKALYDIRETDKTISGRFSMAGKKDDKWFSAHMSFTAFKAEVDEITSSSLLNHGGKALEVFGELRVEMGMDGKGYWKFIIRSAQIAEEKKIVEHWQEKKTEKFNARSFVDEAKARQEEGFSDDSEIPF